MTASTPNLSTSKKKMTWLTYALMTVFFWGVYGVILHKARGAMPDAMAKPPTVEGANAGLKAFLLVCVAYAIIGVVAGYVIKARGATFSFGFSGFSIALLAGIAGAAGAFTLVLALGEAAGKGGYGALAATAVMPIVFGGAPLVNSLVSMLLHPPEGGLKGISPLFITGAVLAVIGTVLVAKFAPVAAAPHGAKKADAPAGAAAAPAAPSSDAQK